MQRGDSFRAPWFIDENLSNPVPPLSVSLSVSTSLSFSAQGTECWLAVLCIFEGRSAEVSTFVFNLSKLFQSSLTQTGIEIQSFMSLLCLKKYIYATVHILLFVSKNLKYLFYSAFWLENATFLLQCSVFYRASWAKKTTTLYWKQRTVGERGMEMGFMTCSTEKN